MQILLHRFNKNLVVWVLLLGVVAYLLPGLFTPLRASINGFFALAMFGIGLVLPTDSYRHMVSSPGRIVFGVLCQFTIMPLLALLTSIVFKLSPEWTLGLILTGAAPGAMTSNVIAHLSKADVSYSVALTAVSTLLCPVLTPLITLTLAGTRIPIAFWPMFITIAGVVFLPLLLGLAVRYFIPGLVRQLHEWPSTLSVLAILVVTSYVIAANHENLEYASFILFVAVMFHNALGMALGYVSGYLIRLDHLRRKTLSIEVGMQNAGLGVVLALAHFGHAVAIPAALFTIWCILTASLLVYFWKYMERIRTREDECLS